MNAAQTTHARRILLLATLVFAAGSLCHVSAQTTSPRHYWIYLNQRTAADLSPQALGISERAIKRRSKVLPVDRLIDKFDYPIPQAVIDQIRSTGARIRTMSRWLNAVSVEATDQQLRSIAAVPSVVSTVPVFDLVFRKP
jgi:hypothetical protein